MNLFLLFYFLIGLNFSKANTFNTSFQYIPHLPSEVFVPNGFDSNDLVQIVIQGSFPDVCHKSGPLNYTIDSVNKEIHITNNAVVYQNKVCSPMTTKYLKPVDLGVLEDGVYNLLFKNGSAQDIELGKLPIKKAEKTTLDDFNYAPIEKIEFYPEQKTAKISGILTNTCLSLGNVEVVTSEDSNVFVVLPILKIDNNNCQELEVEKTFEHTIDLSVLKPGKYLIHVRSLNGQSVNEVINIKK